MSDAVLTVEATDVNSGESDYVHGSDLDTPQAGATAGSYNLVIEGWVFSKSLSVDHVEVLHKERPLALVPLDGNRPDIAAGFPDLEGAEQTGYRAAIGTLALPAEFELVLRAKLENGVRLPLAKLSCKRRRIRSSRESKIQPLMVNTIGRSGSTLLVTLLASHSEVVAFAPWIKDARIATYWMDIFQDLAQPESFLAPFDPPDLEKPHWWLGSQHGSDQLGDPELEQWMGREGIGSLLGMCQERIEEFYAHVAGPGASPRYFVEKFSPYQVLPDLLAETYAGAREVVLVRDFRDILCSVISFNRKRGYEAFGRAESGNDVDYVHQTLAPSAVELVERWRGADQRPHLVRYEDLVHEPREALAALFEHLDVDASEDEIEATLERAASGSGSMDHHRTTTSADASIGRWRNDLPSDVADACHEALGPILAELGYEVPAGAESR